MQWPDLVIWTLRVRSLGRYKKELNTGTVLERTSLLWAGWCTKLCSCYLLGFLQKQKYKSECAFPSDERAFQWLSRLAREFLRPATSLLDRGKDNGTRARTYHNKIRPRSICDGNFLSDIVANFLFRTSCGQWRSIVKELMFLFKLFFWWKYVFWGLRVVMCISKSICYLLFHYDNLFHRKCYSSF